MFHVQLWRFYFDAIRCLQDAEVLLKLTEEVNATLRNKVSLRFCFYILELEFPFNSQQTWTLIPFPSSSLLLSSQAPVNAELVSCLSRTAMGTLPPLAAAVGGLASQEALKAITGKFAPLQQWVGHHVWTVDLLLKGKMLLLQFNSPVYSISIAMYSWELFTQIVFTNIFQHYASFLIT